MKARRRHDLKHDQFADALGRFWDQVVRHRVRVGLAVLGAALLAGIVAALVSSSSMTRADADNRLARAEDEALDLERLRRQNPEESSRKAQAAIDALRSIARDMPSSTAAARALLRAGQLLHAEGKFGEAAEVLRSAVEKSADRPALQALARRALGVALEQAGQYAEAAAIYRQLADTPSRLMKAQALWDLGRCAEALQRPQEALDAYGKAVEAGRESPWGQLAMDRARALKEGPPKAEKGLTPPPPDAKPLTAPKSAEPSGETKKPEEPSKK